MENASKALLFAAGILIAIILISVAVYIVGMANNATSGVASTMTEMQLSSFNSKFTTYEGTSISGSQIRQLVAAVNASNVENADTDLKVLIETNPNTLISGAEDGTYVFSGGTSRRYKVEMTPYKQDGAIHIIKIEGQTTSNP